MTACQEKTAAGASCGNPAMFRMETGELVCRQHRRARQHRGKTFERYVAAGEPAAAEEHAERGEGRKLRPRWRARGARHHCFALEVERGRWVSLCGEVVFLGRIGSRTLRPPPSSRCPACDEAEAARFGDGEQLPTSREWRELGRVE